MEKMAFSNGIIDLRSDTVTHPTESMRQAMSAAAVGDDVYMEDPTVNELERTAAGLLGKESALFVPSGTMGNLIAVMVHCGRGDEAIMGKQGHTFLHEAGGISALGGVFPSLIENKSDGTLPIDDIRNAYREEDVHHPVSKLVIVENTQNHSGGIPLSVGYMRDVGACAHELSMKLHVDGARIFNAAAALKCDVSDLVSNADSVMFCLSKGLCAPVGSLVCGFEEFIFQARKIRKQLGGGMRQAGVLAAAGLVALKEMVSRLEDDHILARQLADRLETLPGVSFPKGYPQTNMVFLAIKPEIAKTPREIQQDLREENVLVGMSGPREFRLVTHYWVNGDDIEYTADAFLRVLTR
jgi:threonine aldolase